MQENWKMKSFIGELKVVPGGGAPWDALNYND